jgi:transposase, IS30 family
VTLASLAQQSYGVREMAAVLNRSPSTISRELRRNRGQQGYASADARMQSIERRKAARPAIKLHADALLFDVVCHFLRLLWSGAAAIARQTVRRLVEFTLPAGSAVHNIQGRRCR